MESIISFIKKIYIFDAMNLNSLRNKEYIYNNFKMKIY